MRTEYECRVLEIDVSRCSRNLKNIGARRIGKRRLLEYIYYDSRGKWISSGRVLRLRHDGQRAVLTYKHHTEKSLSGAHEAEVEVGNIESAHAVLLALGYRRFRIQEKLRDSYLKDEVRFDIDTWPGIPPYMEVEGPTKSSVIRSLRELGIDRSVVTYDDARDVLRSYGVDLDDCHEFVFSTDARSSRIQIV